MVDPFSLADTCAAILDPLVLSGKVSLGQVRRLSIYKHVRSVKGNLLEKCSKLAERQEEGKAEGSFEEADLGRGL